MKLIFSKIGSFFRKNALYKIIALLGAVAVWIYVLNVANPYRNKTIANIPIFFQGETELNDERLVISNVRTELPKADLVISARAMQTVNESVARAYVNLQNIRAPGNYRLKVDATTSIGSVLEITPTTVEVEIDRLRSKRVPVTITFDGALPRGYWKGTPSVAPGQVSINGPEQIVERIRKAVCTVPLDNRTESYYDAMNVTLLDENDDPVDYSSFVGEMPSVTLDMQILPKKTVPIDVADSIMGQENVPATHEIKSIVLKPDNKVEVAGPQEELDQIESLRIGTLELGEGRESVIEYVPIIKPFNDLVLIPDDKVQVYVEIAEKRSELNFVNLSIDIINLDRKLDVVEIKPSQASVLLAGPNSQMKFIQRDNVLLYADVKDLEAGTYDLPIQFSIHDEATDVEPKLSVDVVQVTLAEKE